MYNIRRKLLHVGILKRKSKQSVVRGLTVYGGHHLIFSTGVHKRSILIISSSDGIYDV